MRIQLAPLPTNRLFKPLLLSPRGKQLVPGRVHHQVVQHGRQLPQCHARARLQQVPQLRCTVENRQHCYRRPVRGVRAAQRGQPAPR